MEVRLRVAVPVCVISCLLTFVASANALLHDPNLHLKGLSPVWMRTCLFSVDASKNVFVQP